MKTKVSFLVFSLLIANCGSPSSIKEPDIPVDLPEDTIPEEIFIEEEVIVEEIVEDTVPDNRPPQSATDEYLEKFDQNLLTFENFWPSVFDDSLPPSDRSINQNKIAKFEIKPQEGFSTVAVFDGDFRDDNGYGRCGHGKCIVDIINQFYPGVGIQAISPEDYLWDGDSYLANLPSYYREDVLLKNEGFETRGLASPYLTMISFFNQPNNGKAKIYTTSTSIGSSYTEENLNADYVENEYGEINRDVWKIYNSLDGNRPFDAGMYEVAQYLEDNKEALNGLVVGSVENTVFDENGDIVECYDPNPDPSLYEYGWTPECGGMEDVIFLTGKFSSNWLLVGWAGDYDVIGFPGKYYEDHMVYVRGNPLDSSTSFSTPIVAALAAKIVDTNPELKAEDVKKIILNSADREDMWRSVKFDNDTYATTVEAFEVSIVNWDSAISCATSLSCLNN